MNLTRRYKRKNFKNTVTFFVLFSLVICFVSISIADIKLMETVLIAGEMQIKANVNKAFDRSLEQYIKENNVKTEDFLVQRAEKSNTITANTLLINDLCSKVAVSLSDEFSKTQAEKIKVPIGALSGIAGIANLGPVLMFKVQPVGEAIVDYETSFTSSGINQTHFQIYLGVEVKVRIANPLQKTEIKVQRKMVLLDTLIQGEVPQSYYDKHDY